MGTQSQGKRMIVAEPSQPEEEQDRISGLPREIIGRILSHLPIREAVRTGILSSKWRCKWMTDLSSLVFTDRCVTTLPHVQPVADELVKIISSVLLQHSASLMKFHLQHKNFRATGESDNWILYLSRASVKELILAFSEKQPYRLPSYLFLCQGLVHLDLEGCSIRIPPAFQGFKNLQLLKLCKVAVSEDSLEKLISSCPQLTSLNLQQLPDITHLDIDAPNLRVLDLEGSFRDVTLSSNTRSLYLVRVGFTAAIDYEQVQPEKHASNLCKFCSYLLNVATLSIDIYTIWYLSAGNVPTILPIPLRDLTNLTLSVNLCCFVDVSCSLCLLRSSPSLEHVKFIAPLDEEELFDGDEIDNRSEIYSSPCDLKTIKEVRISDVRGNPSEMAFLKFLLSNCSRLGRMVVRANSSIPAASGGYKFLRELVQFKRASPVAEIIYLEHNEPDIQ